MPRRRGERGSELQPPFSEGQPAYAAHSQSDRQGRSKGQRKYLRDCLSPLYPAHGTQASHRGDRPSTLSTDLADPAPGSTAEKKTTFGNTSHDAVTASSSSANARLTRRVRPWARRLTCRQSKAVGKS